MIANKNKSTQLKERLNSQAAWYKLWYLCAIQEKYRQVKNEVISKQLIRFLGVIKLSIWYIFLVHSNLTNAGFVSDYEHWLMNIFSFDWNALMQMVHVSFFKISYSVNRVVFSVIQLTLLSIKSNISMICMLG